MSQARQFRIRNSVGDIINLMDKKTFATEPEGFGVNIESIYSSHRGSFINRHLDLNQNTITFQVNYVNDGVNPYVVFNDTMRKLDMGPLVLEYEMPGVGVYYRDVKINLITKGELRERHGTLTSTLRVDCMTPWYEWLIAHRESTRPTAGGGKWYGHNGRNNSMAIFYNPDIARSSPSRFVTNTPTRAFAIPEEMATGGTVIQSGVSLNTTLEQREGPIPGGGTDTFVRVVMNGVGLWIRNSHGTIQHGQSTIQRPLSYAYSPEILSYDRGLYFDNNSLYMGTSNDSALHVKIHASEGSGPIENPSWRVYDKDNNLYGTEQFLFTLLPGYTLEVNTDIHARSITMIRRSDNFKTDITDRMDPTADGFVRAPVGGGRVVFGASVVLAMNQARDDLLELRIKEEMVVV